MRAALVIRDSVDFVDNNGLHMAQNRAASFRGQKNVAQRDFEILLDVVAQRLQWRDIENFSAVVEMSRKRLAHQLINAGKECGQRFPRASGRRDEGSSSGENMRPALFLRLGRRPE